MNLEKSNFWCRIRILLTGLVALAAGSTGALAAEPPGDGVAHTAAGLVEVGTQPVGQLSGKIVYTHGGHGITDNGKGWLHQRPLLLNMIEDLGNVDQMTHFAEYLFRAGATVVPIRPVGTQPLEIVLDNDDAGVTFIGPWSDSSSTIYFAGDNNPDAIPYRFARTEIAEFAIARYQPTIAEADFYPVYAWSRSGSDRVSDQLYRVHHSGGTTEVTVNHKRVGNGLVYLGTYYFEEGTDGYVEISNRSNEAGVVIADMIRFGNGMGDINRGNGVSGFERSNEAGLYWVEWHVNRSQGIPDSEYRVSSSDRSATVSLSPRWAEFMNREGNGTLSDRVFVSFHSNAGSSVKRGTLGLLNGNNDPNARTPNQFLLADTLAGEVNDDMVARDGQFEYNWHDQGSKVTLDRTDIEFGEINNLRIQDEFDATIVETAYHDNAQDAELMLDPKVRDALARATYQGVVKYFNSVDDGATQVVMAPGAVTNVRAESTGSGEVTLHWTPPNANAYNGDAATGYRIYTSANGYGFDGGRFVDGSGTTTAKITGLATGAAYYFKVVAVNAGGESPGSEVVAAMPNGAKKDILIVNGFDRNDRALNPRQPAEGGLADRVRPRGSNTFDFAVQVAEAVEAFDPNLAIDTTANESIIDGSVDLGDYTTVIWILGEESSDDDTFDTTEQTAVTKFLGGGGNLFVSGAEIAWDLDNLKNGRTFINDVLHTGYVGDDADTRDVVGVPDSIFDGLSFSFDDGDIFYDVNIPDRITPSAGGTVILYYAGGTGDGAGILFDGGVGKEKVVLFGFPFETITTEEDRASVMARVLKFFDMESSP